MHATLIIYHVGRVEEGLVKTLSNAEPGDLVFITGDPDEDTGTLGILLECMSPNEPLWTTRPISARDLPRELMSRLKHSLSGEAGPQMFQPILDAQNAAYKT